MSALKAGESFPEGVSFLYIPPTGDLDLKACGRPITYDASKGKAYTIPNSLSPSHIGPPKIGRSTE